MLRIERLEVRASLDNPEFALGRARAAAAAGDESWARWAADHERGEALIVRLDVRVVAVECSREVIETSNRGVFVERDVDPPRLEQQIDEMAKTDWPVVTALLQDRGHDIGGAEFDDMYVHVELDPPLRDALRSDAPARRPAPHATAQLSHRPDA